jgi:hypothetical protein
LWLHIVSIVKEEHDSMMQTSDERVLVQKLLKICDIHGHVAQQYHGNSRCRLPVNFFLPRASFIYGVSKFTTMKQLQKIENVLHLKVLHFTLMMVLQGA